MICGALLAVGGAHPSRGHQGSDGHVQAKGHVTVCAVGQPDAGVESDDLGSAHQDDVHNDRQGLVLGGGVHVVAVLAHHAHRYILQAIQASWY